MPSLLTPGWWLWSWDPAGVRRAACRVDSDRGHPAV